MQKLRKEHGNKVIAQVHVEDAILGMRELPVLFHDGSAFDEVDGIKFRGYSIEEIQRKSPKAKEGH